MTGKERLRIADEKEGGIASDPAAQSRNPVGVRKVKATNRRAEAASSPKAVVAHGPVKPAAGAPGVREAEGSPEVKARGRPLAARSAISGGDGTERTHGGVAEDTTVAAAEGEVGHVQPGEGK